LTIKPYIGPTFGEKSFTFEGIMEIHFNCTKPTNKIVFHHKELNFKNESFRLSSPADPTLSIVLPWTNDYPREFFKTNFTRNCQQGVIYVIHIEYVGLLSKNLVGFYRSSYVDKNTNQTH
jgi:aminopeptidase N